MMCKDGLLLPGWSIGKNWKINSTQQLGLEKENFCITRNLDFNQSESVMIGVRCLMFDFSQDNPHRRTDKTRSIYQSQR